MLSAALPRLPAGHVRARSLAKARTAPPAGWSPSYSLPSSGQLVTHSVSWLSDALAEHSGVVPGSLDWSYSLFNSYGAGVFVDDYSAGGAYVWAGHGGHDHPDNTGAMVVDFADLSGKLLLHDNLGARFSTYTNSYGFRDNECTGAPRHEINSSIDGDFAVPRPGHPYQMLAPLPSAIGGGTKGSVIYLGRAGMGEGGQLSSQHIHRFDLATQKWSRHTTATLARADYESSVVYDAARGRYWHVCNGGNFAQSGFQNVEYLRVSDWTVQYTASQSTWPSSNIGQSTGRLFMHAGLLIYQGASNSLHAFDPDDAATGWQTLTVSGTLPSRGNLLVYFPPTGKFYTIGQGGGNMSRVTPPGNPISGTWVADTVTLNASLPAVSTAGDPGGLSDQTNLLFYVPSIQRLAWLPDGSTICLMYPT